MKKRVLALMMAAMMVFSLAACSSSSSEDTSDASADTTEDTAADEDSDIAAIQEAGVLVVGITDFEPMDYLDDSGNWIGFDADLATLLAEALGVEVEFVEIDWDNKILELDNGSIDVVWNGMTLTDEVAEAMNCTDAYLNNAQIVVMAADVIDSYTDTDSLAELSFAVEAGSAGAAAAEELGLTYTELQAQSDALLEVASGSCDAAIIDSLMAAAMVGEGTSYEDLTYGLELTTEEYVVGCRVGSDLTAYINDLFDTWYAEGTLQEIAETYGVTAALVEQ